MIERRQYLALALEQREHSRAHRSRDRGAEWQRKRAWLRVELRHMHLALAVIAERPYATVERTTREAISVRTIVQHLWPGAHRDPATFTRCSGLVERWLRAGSASLSIAA